MSTNHREYNLIEAAVGVERAKLTAEIRDAALVIGNRLKAEHPNYIPDPVEPTAAEDCYLRAIQAFSVGRQCSGWDLVDDGDKLLGIEV